MKLDQICRELFTYAKISKDLMSGKVYLNLHGLIIMVKMKRSQKRKKMYLY